MKIRVIEIEANENELRASTSLGERLSMVLKKALSGYCYEHEEDPEEEEINNADD